MVLHWVAGYSLGISWYLIEEEDYYFYISSVLKILALFDFLSLSLSRKSIWFCWNVHAPLIYHLPFFLIVFSFRGINLIPAASVSITDAPSLTHTHTTESGWKLVFRRVWLKSVNFFWWGNLLILPPEEANMFSVQTKTRPKLEDANVKPSKWALQMQPSGPKHSPWALLAEQR